MLAKSKADLFKLPIRVYIEDTDAGGIVYYVNYLKYMERARTEFMRSLGYSKAAIFSEDAKFVVHSLQVNYMVSAVLDDELEVSAEVKMLKRCSMLIEQGIYRNEKIICRAEVLIVLVSDNTMRPVRLPQTLLEKLN